MKTILRLIAVLLLVSSSLWAQGYNNGGYNGGSGGGGGGGGAPLTNPAGGAGNYAPIDSPAHTGGISLTNNQNASTVMSMSNSDPGGSAATSTQFNNGTATDSFGLTGPGYTAGGATLAANSMYFYNVAANGIEFWDNAAGPISFWIGSTNVGQFSATGLNVAGTVKGSTFIGNGAPAVTGPGNMVANSNSFAGQMNGVAATGNVFTPGFTCPHQVFALFQDVSASPGNPVATAVSTTTVTFSSTAGHAINYIATCL